MPDREIDAVKVVPEVHSETCPVCNGFGSLKYGSVVCHGCKGNGYIFVPNKIDRLNDERRLD